MKFEQTEKIGLFYKRWNKPTLDNLQTKQFLENGKRPLQNTGGIFTCLDITAATLTTSYSEDFTFQTIRLRSG